MKKVIAIVLAIAALLTLGGCAVKSDNLIDGCYDYDLDALFTLGQYKGIVIEVEDPAATDAEIESGFMALLYKNVTYAESDTETLVLGDKADITFEGFLDGEKQDNMSGSSADIQLGSGALIPGFEEGLVGLKKGDKVTLNLVFPDNYRATELRGRPAVFEVVIDKVNKQIAPELTDEYVKENSDYETIEEYREYLRQKIKSDKEKSNQEEYEDAVWSAVVNNSTVDEASRKYPNALAQEMANESIDYMTQVIYLYYQMTFEDYCEYIGFTVDEFKAGALDEAKETLKAQMAIFALCNAEGIKITKEDYDEMVLEYVEEYSMESVEALEETFGKKDIIIDMAFQKVLDLVLDSATMKIKD